MAWQLIGGNAPAAISNLRFGILRRSKENGCFGWTLWVQKVCMSLRDRGTPQLYPLSLAVPNCNSCRAYAEAQIGQACLQPLLFKEHMQLKNLWSNHACWNVANSLSTSSCTFRSSPLSGATGFRARLSWPSATQGPDWYRAISLLKFAFLPCGSC